MFESLTERLSATVQRLRGRGRLTEANIREALREVRIALLEADVALPVVQALIAARARCKALGQEVLESLTPGQALVEGRARRADRGDGHAEHAISISPRTPPAVILMAGLQGAGKTTTVAKLARLLKERRKKKVHGRQRRRLSSGRDRAAADARRSRSTCCSIRRAASRSRSRSRRRALDAARKNFADVLIVDTAGRLHVDEEMMAEIKALHAALNPVETLFVVDSMTGQDAVNTAKAFADALPLTGVILTKTDGDARGGAALSVRHVTGAPIKFIGVGEKTDGLEPFHPERIAPRILGMGDVLSLVEQVEQKVDQDKAKKLAEKVIKGKRFDLNDMKDQLEQMINMGGMAGADGQAARRHGDSGQHEGAGRRRRSASA